MIHPPHVISQVISTGVTSVSIVYGHLPELRPVDPEKDPRFVDVIV